MSNNEETKQSTLNLLRRGMKIQHQANEKLKTIEKEVEDAIKLQNQTLGLGVLECDDITHSKLNTPNELRNSEYYNAILNEIKALVCDVEPAIGVEGFENMNIEIFNRLSLNDHCIYILIVLILILIFKKQIMNNKFIKNIFG